MAASTGRSSSTAGKAAALGQQGQVAAGPRPATPKGGAGGGAGGIRTLTGRNLNPVPLPLGYGPGVNSLSDRPALAKLAQPVSPSSLRSLAT